MNAASVLLTMLGSGSTQTLLDGKINFELYALTGSGDPKNFRIFPSSQVLSLALAPHTSHLVRVLLPNILN